MADHEAGQHVERRVRHELADGLAVMAFSCASSVALAGLLAIVLGSL